MFTRIVSGSHIMLFRITTGPSRNPTVFKIGGTVRPKALTAVFNAQGEDGPTPNERGGIRSRSGRRLPTEEIDALAAYF